MILSSNISLGKSCLTEKLEKKSAEYCFWAVNTGFRERQRETNKQKQRAHLKQRQGKSLEGYQTPVIFAQVREREQDRWGKEEKIDVELLYITYQCRHEFPNLVNMRTSTDDKHINTLNVKFARFSTMSELYLLKISVQIKETQINYIYTLLCLFDGEGRKFR